MKKILIVLVVCLICFVACSKKNNMHESFESAIEEESGNLNNVLEIIQNEGLVNNTVDENLNLENDLDIEQEGHIGKQNRYHVSIVGEDRDSALYIEFIDENNYLFWSPYGGYLWSSSNYKINDDTISFSVMSEEQPFKTEELNELFSSKNTNGYVDFVYDKDFSTFTYTGGYRNGNVGLFPKDSEITSQGSICIIGNSRVIKKSGYLVPIENLNVRTEPSTKAETGVIDYWYELMCLIEDGYGGTGMLNKDYVFNLKQYESNANSPVLLAGMIKRYSAVTEETQTIDGITAPWYRIGFTDNELGVYRYYWIFGGYIKEINDPKTKEYEHLLFDAAVKYGYLIPQAEIDEKNRLAEIQAKLVFESADSLYKLRSFIENNYDRTEKNSRHYTVYYYNDNYTYGHVVEFVNNDLLSDSKLKIGMTEQEVIELFGEPINRSAETMEYDDYKYSRGSGYDLTFTIENSFVTKIEIRVVK